MSDINKIISANSYHEGATNFFCGLTSVTSLNRAEAEKAWGSVLTNSGIGQNGVAVTPSDSTVLAVTIGLWIGVAGNVSVIHDGDTTATTYVGVAAGTLLPFRVTKVMSTNTTATNIVAIYN